jgi:hypothetical protein
MHMISKMKPEGSRLAIVFNGSPLFTGDAGSGESEIRKWIIESDWLEAIVALPTEMFYNTGIATYIWILTNRKRKERRGKVQLINATDLFVKMRKSLGNKRNELSDGNIAEVVDLYGDLTKNGRSKLFDNSDFGYHQITVERPLRLSFQVTPARIAALKEEGAFQKLATSKTKGREGQREIEAGQARQNEIEQMLRTIDASVVDKNRTDFEERLVIALDSAGIKLPAPLRKAILNVMSERDESAEICLDADGDPEPDAELRDYENVPLKENIHVYFDREVRPHVPDDQVSASLLNANILFAGNAPAIRNLETSPPLLNECVGDFASAEKKEWWLLLSISSLGGAGCRSWIRDGGLTYFDLSTASADFEAWLWVHGWSVNDMAIFKVKLGSVIGTHNAITHERTLRKRAAKVRARVGHGKETACATDQKNGYALNHRPGWFVLD